LIRFQPYQPRKFHHRPRLSLNLSRKHDQASLSLIVLVPRLMGWCAVSSKDHSSRPLFPFNSHSLYLALTSNYEGFRTWNYFNSTAHFFLGFSQGPRRVRFVAILDATPDTSQFDHLTSFLFLGRPKAIQESPFLFQDQTGSHKHILGDDVHEPLDLDVVLWNHSAIPRKITVRTLFSPPNLHVRYTLDCLGMTA